MQPLPDSEIPRLGAVMRERGHLFIPMAVVVAGLGLGYSATLCALVGAAACLPVALLRRATRASIAWSSVWDALADAARNSVSVAMACACAGIVLGVITLTGSGIAFTAVIIELARNSLILALLLTMVAGIILGMGMPTTPAYIIMVALLVPALIKLGVVTPAAHMFAFYFAILSAITPPVALAVYAAAGLAKADLWQAGLAAVRVGAAGFIVPFMFVFQPGLLMIGAWHEIALAAGTGTLGILFLAASLHGHLHRGLALWERGVVLIAALLLIDPNWLTDLIGAALGGGIWLRQRFLTTGDGARRAPGTGE
jgi:TRAP transporter 4TM/12TM fusion protein